MDFKDTFLKENINLLFEEIKHKGEFFAMACDLYSSFSEQETYDLEWARNFSPGRYVIVIYQRHSVYKNGKCVFMNTEFDNAVGKYCRHKTPQFVLISDKEREYYIKNWDIKGWECGLKRHTIQDENNPLQAKYYDFESAEIAAINYSKSGESVVIAEWFNDYDMY